MQDGPNIFLVGGGTGGHLFPAISIAEELEARNFKTYLITDKRCEKYLPPNFKIETIVFNLGSMSSGVINKVKTLFNMAIAFAASIKLIYQKKPTLIVGFGGYPSFPGLLAGRFMGVPIVIHEQNCFMGKVNKFFAKSAMLIGLNFKQTLNLDPKFSYKTVVVGNPVRKEITKHSFIKDFSAEPFVIFIIGGSQGAAIFDDLIPQAIELLVGYTNKKIKVIQQAAAKNHDKISEQYASLNIEHEMKDFFHDIYEKYNQAHLVISRAGASAIAEFIYVGQPAILIPLPTAACDHQSYNAKALAQHKAAFYLPQQEVTPDAMAKKILEYINNPEDLRDMSQNLIKMRIDATKVFVDRLLDHVQLFHS